MLYAVLFFVPFWLSIASIIYALLYRGKNTNPNISENEWLELKQKVDALTMKNAVTRKL